MMRSVIRSGVQGLGLVLAAIGGLAACGEKNGPDTPTASVLTVSPLTIEFPQTGQQQTITAFPVDRRGSPVDVVVTFTSSNPAIASLSGQTNRTAVVTGVSAGTATITATTGSLSATTSITVRCRIQFAAPNPAVIGALFVNQQQTITITVTADPGCSNAVNWSSSNTGVASVDQTGKVTGVSAGQAAITIRSVQDPAIQVAVPVTVLSVVSVTLPPSAQVDVQSQLQLTAATNPAGVPLSWTTSNPNIATVTQTGLVSGVADGTVIITATATPDLGKSAQTSVRVRGRVTGLTVNPTSAQLVVPNKVTIVPTVTADPGVDRSVTWSTSDQAVATVDGNGEVTAVGQGQATITATALADVSRQASATVNVTGRVLSITVSPPVVTMQLGGQPQQLTATVVADPGVDVGVDWSSSNPGVASVHPTTGLVTAVSSGQATITARSRADATKTGAVSVTVNSVTVAINERTPVVTVGGTLQMTATVTPPGAVTWTSQDITKATVNAASGLVTGVATGTAVIVATSATTPSAKDQVTVTVTQCTPNVIAISPSPAPAIVALSAQQFTASFPGCGGSFPVVWSSSNPGVLSVDNTGSATGMARGTATLTVKLASNQAIQASVSVTVLDVTVSVTPTSDSIRVAWQKQLTPTVVADAPLASTYICSSNNVLVATVNAATCLVTGVSVGTATITVRSTANQARTANATIQVGTSCTIPVMFQNTASVFPVLPQTQNGAVGSTPCGPTTGTTELFGMRVQPAQGFELTGTAPWSFNFAPIIGPTGFWYWGNVGSGFKAYVAAASGTYRASISPTAANTGAVSIALAAWNVTGCPAVFTTTGLTFTGLPITTACGTYQPTGAPVGTYYTQFLYVVPPIPAGQTLTLTAGQAGGIDPRLELFVNGASVAAAAAAPGSGTVTLNYTPGVFSYVHVRLSTLVAGVQGNVRLAIGGPSASYMVRDANAFVSGMATGGAMAPIGNPCFTTECEAAIAAGRAAAARGGTPAIQPLSPAPPARRQ